LIALAGADLWPRGPNVQVEQHFRADPWHGWIDISDFTDMPEIQDHKTTKDFGYAKDPLQLIQDPQAVIYSDAAMRLTGAPKVRLRWLYYRTKKPHKRLPIIVEVDRPTIAPALIKMEETAKQIQALLKIPGLKGLDLPPNAASCDAYGGCEHRERCNLSDHERIFSLMTQGNFLQGAQSHEEMLAALQASANQAQPQAQAQQPQQAPQAPPGYAPQYQQPQAPPALPYHPQASMMGQGYVPQAPPGYPPQYQQPQAPPPGYPPGFNPQAVNPPPVAPPSPQPPAQGLAPVAPPSPQGEKPKRGRPSADARSKFVSAWTKAGEALADLLCGE
jgi:hypothetical protein